MERCLSEKALVLLHSGEGSQGDRAHVESCLSCARRYRALSDQLGTIVATLRQPQPAMLQGRRFAYPRLGWSLAAAAVILAFVCGRLTAFGVGDQNAVGLEQLSELDSTDQGAPSVAWEEASNAGIASPVSYGLYIDDLMAQDEPDQNPVVAAANVDADSDE